ncbi:hypothetical protein [Candidatus Hodgkinia cicadicola]|uniref:hypothetical protein n=1 Tax=Candidatus Hodgkinia cicadicola TaxID=573658 RepID=UPI0011BACBAC
MVNNVRSFGVISDLIGVSNVLITESYNYTVRTPIPHWSQRWQRIWTALLNKHRWSNIESMSLWCRYNEVMSLKGLVLRYRSYRLSITKIQCSVLQTRG